MKQLDNCTVLITGAAEGLGHALAIEASCLGARVLIVDIADGTPVAKQIQGLGGKAEAYMLDISDYDAVAELARRIEDKFGAVNILINNAAAGGGPGSIEHADPQQVRRVFDVNVFGTFCMISTSDDISVLGERASKFRADSPTQIWYENLRHTHDKLTRAHCPT